MIGLLVQSTASLIALALVFALLVAAVFAVENDTVRAWLQQQDWFRRFEALPTHELQFRGMVSLGCGVCCFAALLTLRLLFPDTQAWAALALALASVMAITIGAALLERAGRLR
jgi:hypothetical protein